MSQGGLSESPLFFFPGWLCHFKGLLIPVWREIHQSKTLRVMSLQLTCRAESDISRCSRHVQHVNQFFFPHGFTI